MGRPENPRSGAHRLFIQTILMRTTDTRLLRSWSGLAPRPSALTQLPDIKLPGSEDDQEPITTYERIKECLKCVPSLMYAFMHTWGTPRPSPPSSGILDLTLSDEEARLLGFYNSFTSPIAWINAFAEEFQPHFSQKLEFLLVPHIFTRVPPGWNAEGLALLISLFPKFCDYYLEHMGPHEERDNMQGVIGTFLREVQRLDLKARSFDFRRSREME